MIFDITHEERVEGIYSKLDEIEIFLNKARQISIDKVNRLELISNLIYLESTYKANATFLGFAIIPIDGTLSEWDLIENTMPGIKEKLDEVKLIIEELRQ